MFKFKTGDILIPVDKAEIFKTYKKIRIVEANIFTASEYVFEVLEGLGINDSGVVGNHIADDIDWVEQEYKLLVNTVKLWNYLNAL